MEPTCIAVVQCMQLMMIRGQSYIDFVPANHFDANFQTPLGVLYRFWVRGHAIGKGFDFHDFGIRNGVNFCNFHEWYRVGYVFSENWYKVTYTISEKLV